MGKLGVILLHWHNTSDVEDWIETARARFQGEMEIVVIDNSDNIDESTLPVGIDLIRPGQNLGFAEGCNRGFQHLLTKNCDHVLLSNVDITWEPGTIHALSTTLMNTENCIAISPVILEVFDSQSQIHIGGRHPLYYERTRMTSRDEDDDLDYLPGTFLIIKSIGWQDTGSFDSSFFFSGEVADWFLRINRKKWRFDTERNFIVTHLKNKNGIQSSFYRQYYSQRNRFLFIEKYGGNDKKIFAKNWVKKINRKLLGLMFRFEFKRYKILYRAKKDGLNKRFGRSVWLENYLSKTI